MPLRTAEPPFLNLARQARKLMDPMQKGYFQFSPVETWTPSVNLYETASAYLVCVDLAGVDKEKIDVQVADNRLRLSGTRAVPTCQAVEEAAASEHGSGAGHGQAHGQGAGPEPRRFRVHLMEIDHGAFSREVELPRNVRREDISAQYRNGILWIEIPKT